EHLPVPVRQAYVSGCRAVVNGETSYPPKSGPVRSLGFLCGSEQWRYGLKKRMKRQCRKFGLFLMPFPEITVRYSSSDLQHQVSTLLRPAHLLVFDHSF